MLDVILDCFGMLVFLGQAAFFLAFGEIEQASTLPTAAGTVSGPAAEPH